MHAACRNGFALVELLVVIAIAVYLIGLVGCGNATVPTGKVAGTVSLRGKPFDLGVVRFVKSDGVPVGSARLGPAGQFQFNEPIPVGDYRVAIVPPGEEAPAGAPAPRLDQAMKAIPPKYRSEGTSGFTATVKEGENSLAFEMQ